MIPQFDKIWNSNFIIAVLNLIGTLVTTEDGQEPIEEIEVGDKVLSEDETTGEVAVKTVTETYVNETDELIHIGVNGETISATPTHPFYVDKLGWTLARLNTKKSKAHNEQALLFAYIRCYFTK